jgi:hypothetical protein
MQSILTPGPNLRDHLSYLEFRAARPGEFREAASPICQPKSVAETLFCSFGNSTSVKSASLCSILSLANSGGTRASGGTQRSNT